MKRQAKRLCETALLAAVGLGIFVLEAQLPPLTAVPGIKPGLANCVTLAALYLLGCREAAGVLAVRILLGAVYTGSPVSLLYSAAGGLACYLVMAPLSRVFPARQLWIVSVFGALAHNAGQLAAAAVLLGRLRTTECFVMRRQRRWVLAAVLLLAFVWQCILGWKLRCNPAGTPPIYIELHILH